METEFTFSNVVFENKRRTPDEYKPIIREIKRDIIKSLALAKSGHPGGPLGVADFMGTLFFGGYMKYDSKNPNYKDRDRFVLSAGHMAPVLYSCLAHAGFFEPSELAGLRKLGCRLQGHPAPAGVIPGSETASGSLGQGISIAVGMAMNDKLLDKSNRKVFCLTGDGEIQEGSCWEAAMAASNYKLDNLCVIVDNNNLQIDGTLDKVMNPYLIDEKFRSFNFHVINIDGHNYDEIKSAFEEARRTKGQPTAIIAKTIKGKGVSFMENECSWHGKAPNEEQYEIAMKELNSIYQ